MKTNDFSIDDKYEQAYRQGYEAARQETMKLMLSQTKAVAKIQQENAELRHQLKEIADQNQKLREAIVRGKEDFYD